MSNLAMYITISRYLG